MIKHRNSHKPRNPRKLIQLSGKITRYRYNNLYDRPGQTASRRRRGLGRFLELTCWTLPLAALGMISILMMTVLACTLVGLFTLPTTEQNVALTRRPIISGRRLPTFTPTPAVVQGVVPLPTVAGGNAVEPSTSPTPTPVNAYVESPSAAGDQNNSLPTLTSRVALNVRSGPGLEHGVVGQLAVGQSTAITGQNPDGSWWQIEYPSESGQQAWVSANPQYSTVSQTIPQTIAQAPTPTSQPGATAEAATSPSLTSLPPAPTAIATTTEVPPAPTETAVPTSTPTETPIPLPAGWVFNSVHPVSISGGRYLMVTGILFNNTGTSQTLNEIKHIFPGDQGLTSASNYHSYYPVSQVSQGGWIPFKLLLPDPDTPEDFELEAVGSEGGDGPRQQFEFLDVNAITDNDKYCVVGKVRNSGDQLNTYLVVAAVLYDGEGKVINYNDYEAETPQIVTGDQREVNICVDSLGQEVARYELQAWGL